MASTIQDKLTMIKKIATDFSKSPFGRSTEDGTYNGTRFRELFLKKWVAECLESNETLEIDLDDLDIPMTSSFMEESFGGLVRFGYASKEKLKEILSFRSTDPSYEFEIFEYIEEAVSDSQAQMYKY